MTKFYSSIFTKDVDAPSGDLLQGKPFDVADILSGTMYPIYQPQKATETEVAQVGHEWWKMLMSKDKPNFPYMTFFLITHILADDKKTRVFDSVFKSQVFEEDIPEPLVALFNQAGGGADFKAGAITEDLVNRLTLNSKLASLLEGEYKAVTKEEYAIFYPIVALCVVRCVFQKPQSMIDRWSDIMATIKNFCTVPLTALGVTTIEAVNCVFNNCASQHQIYDIFKIRFRLDEATKVKSNHSKFGRKSKVMTLIQNRNNRLLIESSMNMGYKGFYFDEDKIYLTKSGYHLSLYDTDVSTFLSACNDEQVHLLSDIYLTLLH
jgi:hypothetical protein